MFIRTRARGDLLGIYRLVSAISAPALETMDASLMALQQQAGEIKPPMPKRSKVLKSYDQSPHQLLNSQGESGIERVELKDLNNAMSQGNKGAEFFSELYNDDKKLKGTAVSRNAEVVHASIVRLESPLYAKWISEKVLKEVKTEMAPIKQACVVLMAGKSIPVNTSAKSVGNIAYGGSAIIYKEEQEVVDAARVLYQWLVKPDSKFRTLLHFLSGSGIFFVAQCHEKTHRAWIAHANDGALKTGAVSEEEYVEIAKLRLCKPGGTAVTSSLLDGLA